MPANELFLEGPINDGHRLRIDFFKLADRYGHRLSVALRAEDGRETLVPLAESVEGTADDPWPPSPPLQSLSIETLPDARRAALLVGMAGRSHWSASMEVKADESVVSVLEFDLACQSSESPRSISTEYRLFSGVEAAFDPKTGLLLLRAQKITVSIKALQGCDQPSLLDNETRFRLQVPVDQTRSARTIRWRYATCIGRIDINR